MKKWIWSILIVFILSFSLVSAITIQEDTIIEYEYNNHTISFIFKNNIDFEQIIVDDYVQFNNDTIKFLPTTDITIFVYSWNENNNSFGIVGTAQTLPFEITDGITTFNISMNNKVFQNSINITTTEKTFQYGIFTEEKERQFGSPTGHLINVPRPDFVIESRVIDDFSETLLYLLLIIAVVIMIILIMRKRGNRLRKR